MNGERQASRSLMTCIKNRLSLLCEKMGIQCYGRKQVDSLRSTTRRTICFGTCIATHVLAACAASLAQITDPTKGGVVEGGPLCSAFRQTKKKKKQIRDGVSLKVCRVATPLDLIDGTMVSPIFQFDADNTTDALKHVSDLF